MASEYICPDCGSDATITELCPCGSDQYIDRPAIDWRNGVDVEKLVKRRDIAVVVGRAEKTDKTAPVVKREPARASVAILSAQLDKLKAEGYDEHAIDDIMARIKALDS